VRERVCHRVVVVIVSTAVATTAPPSAAAIVVAQLDAQHPRRRSALDFAEREAARRHDRVREDRRVHLQHAGTLAVDDVEEPEAGSASEEVRTVLRTLCSIKIPVLLSVATCTAPTNAGMLNVAFVTRMILMVPGGLTSQPVTMRGSPARTALVTPTVQKHSSQIAPACSRSTMSCVMGTAVMRPITGILALTRTASRPRYLAGSLHFVVPGRWPEGFAGT